MKAICLKAMCLIFFLSNTVNAHTMKDFSINETSYSESKTISMVIVNDANPMDYEIIVDGQLLGTIGEKIPSKKEFRFEVELPTPINKISQYQVCTRTLPEDDRSKMTVCGKATLNRL